MLFWLSGTSSVSTPVFFVPVTTTFALALQKAFTIAAPIPRVPPVIIIVLSVKSNSGYLFQLVLEPVSQNMIHD